MGNVCASSPQNQTVEEEEDFTDNELTMPRSRGKAKPKAKKARRVIPMDSSTSDASSGKKKAKVSAGKSGSRAVPTNPLGSGLSLLSDSDVSTASSTTRGTHQSAMKRRGGDGVHRAHREESRRRPSQSADPPNSLSGSARSGGDRRGVNGHAAWEALSSVTPPQPPLPAPRTETVDMGIMTDPWAPPLPPRPATVDAAVQSEAPPIQDGPPAAVKEPLQPSSPSRNSISTTTTTGGGSSRRNSISVVQSSKAHDRARPTKPSAADTSQPTSSAMRFTAEESDTESRSVKSFASMSSLNPEGSITRSNTASTMATGSDRKNTDKRKKPYFNKKRIGVWMEHVDVIPDPIGDIVAVDTVDPEDRSLDSSMSIEFASASANIPKKHEGLAPDEILFVGI